MQEGDLRPCVEGGGQAEFCFRSYGLDVVGVYLFAFLEIGEV